MHYIDFINHNKGGDIYILLSLISICKLKHNATLEIYYTHKVFKIYKYLLFHSLNYSFYSQKEDLSVQRKRPSSKIMNTSSSRLLFLYVFLRQKPPEILKREKEKEDPKSF